MIKRCLSCVFGRSFNGKPRYFFNSTVAQPLVVPGKEKLVGGWLFLAAAGVLGMIVLGGYTRLTHSGLSIADWSPYTKKYPSNDQEWEVEFDKYKKCIEYQTVNKDMTVEQFKPIYNVQFIHRQMGMWLGYLYMLPLGVFLWKGYLSRKMQIRCIGLGALGGLQGLIGWWMVKSGLDKKEEYQSRPRVSPYRLSTHLMMATTLYAGLLWHSFHLLIPAPVIDPSDLAKVAYLKKIRFIGIIMIKCIILNIFTGALVAGIDAGRMYNTWPLMNGAIIPPTALQKQPKWKNFFENPAMVQFVHRSMAYITQSLSFYLFYTVFKHRVGGVVTVAALIAGLMINYQALNGILMLLQLVPKEKANIHQMTAIITFSTVLMMVFLTKGRVNLVV